LSGIIKYILGNPKVYGEMSANCREKIREEFSPEKIAKDILQEYLRYPR